MEAARNSVLRQRAAFKTVDSTAFEQPYRYPPVHSPPTRDFVEPDWTRPPRATRT